MVRRRVSLYRCGESKERIFEFQYQYLGRFQSRPWWAMRSRFSPLECRTRSTKWSQTRDLGKRRAWLDVLTLKLKNIARSYWSWKPIKTFWGNRFNHQRKEVIRKLSGNPFKSEKSKFDGNAMSRIITLNVVTPILKRSLYFFFYIKAVCNEDGTSWPFFF